MNRITYSQYNTTANDTLFSYHPMPFYEDSSVKDCRFSKKLDLNLYCIKRPQQTCFIRVGDPDMLAWGIERGDMLVVEKNEDLYIGDLVVIEQQDKLEIFELVAAEQGEYLFFALSSKASNIKTSGWQSLPIVGTVTNTIHQIKPRKSICCAA